MKRLNHAIISFLVVLACYMLYSKAVVPFIEPQVRNRRVSIRSGSSATDRSHKLISNMIDLFPPGSWQLDSPRVFDMEQSKLLMGKYEIGDDGKVRIKPCTIVNLPDRPGMSERERYRQAIVLEAPEAVLEFEHDFDLTSGASDNEFKSGQLLGEVTIRSNMKERGPEDDLWVNATDLQIRGNVVDSITPTDRVSFRIGQSYGSGSQMTIQLKQSTASRGAPSSTNFSGLERFDILQLDSLHLVPKEKPDDINSHTVDSRSGHGSPLDVTGDYPPHPARISSAMLSRSMEPGPQEPAQQPMPDDNSAVKSSLDTGSFDSSLPIDITCLGPFSFDMESQSAEFEKQVVASQTHPNGMVDRIEGDLLTITFSRVRDGTLVSPTLVIDADVPPPPDARPKLQELRPRAIEVTGSPARITAPSHELVAIADRIYVDIQEESIKLEIDPEKENPSREVQIFHKTHEIHAPMIEYLAIKDDPVGQVTCAGPGWMQGSTEEDETVATGQNSAAGPYGAAGQYPSTDPGPKKIDYTGSWNDRLVIQPVKDQREHKLSITGSIAFNHRKFGSMKAEEMHFWFRVAPDSSPEAKPDDVQFVPRRAMLIENVDLKSEKVDCKVDQLEAWFQQNIAVQGVPYHQDQQNLANSPRSASAGPPFASAVPGSSSPAGPQSSLGKNESTGHFTLTGKLLQLGFVVDDENKAQLDKFQAKNGHVHLVESQLSDPSERPIIVDGEAVEAVKLAGPNSEMKIYGGPGSPAHFEGRGIELTGSNIGVNRGTNEVQVIGPGQMTLPMDKDLDGKPLRNPEPLVIRWVDWMKFDGLVAKFHGNVNATTSKNLLVTPQLHVTMDRPIRFDELEKSRSTPGTVQQLSGQQYASRQYASQFSARQRPGPSKKDPQPQLIECFTKVFMENRQYDEITSHLKSRQRIDVENISLNLKTGRIASEGGGLVTSIEYGASKSESLFGQSTPAHPATARPATARPVTPPEKNSFSYRKLRFHDRMDGNFNQKIMHVYGKVQCTYGPVAGWDSTIDDINSDRLPEDTVLMRCQQITIAQSPQVAYSPNSSDPKQNFEVIAIGNTYVEGESFGARAERISFDPGKGLLVLEGNDRSDAILYLESSNGGPQEGLPARKILFWPETRHFDLQGVRSSGIDAL